MAQTTISRRFRTGSPAQWLELLMESEEGSLLTTSLLFKKNSLPCLRLSLETTSSSSWELQKIHDLFSSLREKGDITITGRVFQPTSEEGTLVFQVNQTPMSTQLEKIHQRMSGYLISSEQPNSSSSRITLRSKRTDLELRFQVLQKKEQMTIIRQSLRKSTLFIFLLRWGIWSLRVLLLFFKEVILRKRKTGIFRRNQIFLNFLFWIFSKKKEKGVDFK